jgi:hypothetical protein
MDRGDGDIRGIEKLKNRQEMVTTRRKTRTAGRAQLWFVKTKKLNLY